MMITHRRFYQDVLALAYKQCFAGKTTTFSWHIALSTFAMLPTHLGPNVSVLLSSLLCYLLITTGQNKQSFVST